MFSSDHNSQSYGKYYSPDQITELFAPSEETVNAVRGWLERAGLAADRVVPSINKQWLQFDASIAELEDLVKAKVSRHILHVERVLKPGQWTGLIDTVSRL